MQKGTRSHSLEGIIVDIFPRSDIGITKNADGPFFHFIITENVKATKRRASKFFHHFIGVDSVRVLNVALGKFLRVNGKIYFPFFYNFNVIGREGLGSNP